MRDELYLSARPGTLGMRHHGCEGRPDEAVQLLADPQPFPGDKCLRLESQSNQQAVHPGRQGLVDLSLVIGFLYNPSGGNLLVAVLAHSAADVADGLRFAVVADPAWALRSALIQMAAMTVAAAVIVSPRAGGSVCRTLHSRGPAARRGPSGVRV